MGIGNECEDHRPEFSGRLITPHGDRKRCGRVDYPGIDVISLPLMGIGNALLRLQLLAHGLLLITPHGDRKLQIGTHGGNRFTVLITPHGDRKHMFRGREVVVCFEDSLPLMGIGNSRAWPWPAGTSGTHYPSWGSETLQGRQSSGRGQELITPHGDRKRAIR